MAEQPSVEAVTLGELAVQFGCELHGDPDLRIDRVAALAAASVGAIGFVVNARWRDELRATAASAVILGPDLLGDCPVAALVARNPHAVFARVAQRLHPASTALPGRHASAVVEADAVVDPTAEIQALAYVGRQARIGARAIIGQGSVIGAGAFVAEDVRLHPRVTICDGVRIGPRSILHSGAVIGGDGFGHANERGVWVRVPQIGTVVLGADVEVGCNTAIDRGALGDTVIEDGVKIDNQVQIGHNCRIGAHTAIAGRVGMAGSSVIGKRCQFAGDAGVAGHVTICDDVIVTARALITSSIDQAGVYSGVFPAELDADWKRLVAEFRRIGKLRERVRKLEESDP
jgi:UDP-3-O-[3-hydroxymyristoyl] glucosamine N-acyltransferase